MTGLRAAAIATVLSPLFGCADDEDPRAAVAALMADPTSAKFQSVREGEDFSCGEVNGRAREGGFTGYRRFVYDKRAKAAVLDLRIDEQAVTTLPADPACGKPFAYQTVEERLSCGYGPAERAQSDQQRKFDVMWSRACTRRGE